MHVMFPHIISETVTRTRSQHFNP